MPGAKEEHQDSPESDPCSAGKLDRRGVRGGPDLVIEVLSPASASHDHVRKRVAYERAGVREYRLVHPADRMVTVYRWESGSFGKPDMQELAGATAIGVLPGVLIGWDQLVQRLPAPEAPSQRCQHSGQYILAEDEPRLAAAD